MAEKKNLITQAGLNKLQEELDYRIAVVRNEIAKEIEFARSYGDLSENAEYTEAKNKQTENETEIARLEDIISAAVVVPDDAISTDQVSVGVTVRVLDVEFNEEMEYSIVGAQEADPMSGRISDERPIGAGLIGMHVGDVTHVEIPAGQVTLKVLDIMR